RVQHSLRAFTPRDQKAVRVAAQTFRPNPAFSTEDLITRLGVGEALVSVLDAKGTPTPVRRTLISPPQSRIGPLDTGERDAVMARSPYCHRYDKVLDRESAWEILAEKSRAKLAPQQDKASAPRARASGGRQRQGVVE